MSKEQDENTEFLPIPHFPNRREFKPRLEPQQIERITELANMHEIGFSEVFRRIVLSGLVVHYAKMKGDSVKITREKELVFFDQQSNPTQQEPEGFNIGFSINRKRQRQINANVGSAALAEIEDVANFHHRTVEEVFQESIRLGLEITEASVDPYSQAILTESNGEWGIMNPIKSFTAD